MNLLRILGIGLLGLVLLASPAWALTVYTATSTTTFSWTDPNPVGKVASFEVTLTRDGTSEKFVFVTTSTSVQVKANKVDKNGKRLKSGKYKVEVRSLGVNGVYSTTGCSSLDIGCALLKTGQPGDWKVYYKPSGPVGPILVQ